MHPDRTGLDDDERAALMAIIEGFENAARILPATSSWQPTIRHGIAAIRRGIGEPRLTVVGDAKAPR